MKFRSVLSAAFLLSAVVSSVHAQEELSDADKALFDDLQVTEEAEKSARQRIEKSEAPPQPELSAAAAKILDRLQVFEASINDITDESIALSRKTLSERLIKLSNTAAEPGKTELIATAKKIEGLARGGELPPAGTGGDDIVGDWVSGNGLGTYSFGREGNLKTSHNYKGIWRWLNGSKSVLLVDYSQKDSVDVMRLVTESGRPPHLEFFNGNASHFTLTKGQPESIKPGLPAEAGKLITAARARETQVRSASLKQTGEKRERVAAWLVEKAKSDPPASAKLLLDNAGKLRAGAGQGKNNSLRNADAFRGKVYLDNKQRTWEFVPDGKVKSKGLSWGFWEWAAVGGDSKLVIIYSGVPGKAENVMLVRPATSSPGTMHFIGFDDKFDAKLKP